MKNKRGYTLIEVLASFLIISILSTSITAVILNSITTTKDRRYRIIATSVAENYVHDIKDSINTERVLDATQAYWQTVTADDSDITFTSSNTLLLTKNNTKTYMTESTVVYDKLYGDNGLVLDGTNYNSDIVTVRLGVKNYKYSDSKKYQVIVAIVKINYNGGRTMEVIRDVY